MSDKFSALVKDHPERSRIIKNYARNRNWLVAHSRHGALIGLSLGETKAFGNWMHGRTTTSDGIQKLEIESHEDGLVVHSRGPRIKSLQDLLNAAEVDPKKWLVNRYKVNTWEVASKGVDGNPSIIPVWQVKADLEPRRFEELKEVKPVQVFKREPPVPRRENIKRALFIPDSQHGFRWVDKYKRLDPLHDRVAIDAVVQLAIAFQPDVIVLLGDMVDFAPWSTKFPREPALKQTTQPTLEELHWQLAQFRLACPRARIVYTAGNHEARLGKAQVQHLDEAVGLRFANDDADTPVLHVRRLLALDSLDIEYVGPYDTDWWLWDRIRIHHGSTVRAGGGSTVASRVKDGDWPEVFGHIHRVEMAQRMVLGPKGTRVITAMSPGCLCRTDGSVPGNMSIPDWHQGVGIGYYDEVNETDHMHVIPIHDGKLIFDGRIFSGEDRSEEIAEITGYTQISFKE